MSKFNSAELINPLYITCTCKYYSVKTSTNASQPSSVPVKQRSAWVGAERSGVRVQGAGGAGGSCGARGSVGGDGRSVRGWGGGGGHGVGIREAGPACAGEGESAGGGARPDPAAMASSPSYDPWSSCCRSPCPLDGGQGQLSVSA